MDIACYVGIDVAKDRLDVHIRPQAKTFAVANSASGVAELTDLLAPLRVDKVILEASGGYEKLAFLALVEAGHPVAIVNPRQVRDFAKGAGRMAKTDMIDAAVLAHFAEVFHPRETAPLTPLESQISEYVVYRRYLVREMIGIRNQLRRLTTPSIRHVLEQRLAAAKRECKAVETEMAALVRKSEKRPLFDLLTSVPGVGTLLACTLIASLRELGMLSRREIAGLVGVAPMNNDSGGAAWSPLRHRGPQCDPHHTLHGDLNRQPVQRADQSLLWSPVRGRQAAEGGADGVHEEAADDAERNGPGRQALEEHQRIAAGSG